MKRGRILSAVLLVGVSLLLVGCPEQTTIGRVLEDPGHYANKDVALRGTVSNSFGVLGHGAYELDDGTGKIWVLVERGGVPSKGARVRTAGRVISAATFGGRNFATALREKEHRLDR